MTSAIPQFVVSLHLVVFFNFENLFQIHASFLSFQIMLQLLKHSTWRLKMKQRILG